MFLLDLFSEILKGHISISTFIRYGTPKLAVNEINQKKVMEQALRDACEHFIKQGTTNLIGTVASFMNKVIFSAFLLFAQTK